MKADSYLLEQCNHVSQAPTIIHTTPLFMNINVIMNAHNDIELEKKDYQKKLAIELSHDITHFMNTTFQ